MALKTVLTRTTMGMGPSLEDEFPRDGSEWEDLDGDGVGNNKDIDDDNGGINDAIESPNRNEDFDGDGIPIILIMIAIMMVVRMSLRLDSLIVMETIFWVTYRKLNLMR